LKYVTQPEIAKNALKPRYFFISRSFKVIDVSTPESSSVLLVVIYAQVQQVYPQPFSR